MEMQEAASCWSMAETQELSKNMEVKKRAEHLEKRRQSVSRCLSVLFKPEENNDCQRKSFDENASKDAELAQAADRLELKRKMSGKWLEICRQKEKEK